MDSTETQKDRIIAVKLPRKYYRAVRRLAAAHEMPNAQVICWALDVLERDEREGGSHE